MTSTSAWPDLIGNLVLLKQRISELDLDGPLEYVLPKVSASEKTLVDVEAQLGEAIDPGYREFLGYADGWPSFFVSLQLIGARDLLGRLRSAADANLANQFMYPWPGLDQRDLFPVAVSLVDKDVVVVGRPGTSMAGRCLLLAGEVVHDCESFKDFFEAMVGSHRRILDELRAAAGSTPPGTPAD